MGILTLIVTVVLLCCSVVALILYGAHYVDWVTVVWFVWSIFVFFCPLVLSLFRRRWGNVILVMVAIALPIVAVWACRRADIQLDSVRFSLVKQNYLRQVTTLPTVEGGLKFHIWDWDYLSGIFVGNQSVVWVLIYDNSDQIGKPRVNRTKLWVSSVDKLGYKESVYVHPEIIYDPNYFDTISDVRHIDGHFYIMSLLE